MIHPQIETLLARESLEGSKFALVTLASYRARQINSYFNQLGRHSATLKHPTTPKSPTPNRPDMSSLEGRRIVLGV
ncbi:MAG: DNA-directed RNA polymerase subunit omega, partial [Actinobacteria bacterium]|nr:DNA-directed RNA polymerase subunit omega [Actinomycetota bacterium]